MQIRLKTIFLLTSLILIICSAIFFFWLYSPFRQELLFITNAKEIHQPNLQWKFARQGWTLHSVTIPWDQVSNRSILAEVIQNQVRKQTQLVVCSPIISFALDGEVEAIKPGGSSLETVGMTNVSGFDYILVRQEQDAGWIASGKAASVVAHKTPLPTVLLYSENDRQAQIGAQLFSTNFTGGILDALPVDLQTEQQIQSTVDSIKDRGALLIVVPYLSKFTQFLANGTFEGTRWIVDELYAPMIEDKNLEGVVFDDVYQSLLPLLQKGDANISRELPLVRNYRAYGTKWRNWF